MGKRFVVAYFVDGEFTIHSSSFRYPSSDGNVTLHISVAAAGFSVRNTPMTSVGLGRAFVLPGWRDVLSHFSSELVPEADRFGFGEALTSMNPVTKELRSQDAIPTDMNLPPMGLLGIDALDVLSRLVVSLFRFGCFASNSTYDALRDFFFCGFFSHALLWSGLLLRSSFFLHGLFSDLLLCGALLWSGFLLFHSLLRSGLFLRSLLFRSGFSLHGLLNDLLLCSALFRSGLLLCSAIFRILPFSFRN